MNTDKEKKPVPSPEKQQKEQPLPTTHRQNVTITMEEAIEESKEKTNPGAAKKRN